MTHLGYITFNRAETIHPIIGYRRKEREIDYLDELGNERTCKYSECSLVGRPRF